MTKINRFFYVSAWRNQGRYWKIPLTDNDFGIKGYSIVTNRSKRGIKP